MTHRAGLSCSSQIRSSRFLHLKFHWQDCIAAIVDNLVQARLSSAKMSRPTLVMASISHSVPRVQTITHIRCRPRESVLHHRARSFTTSRSALAVTAQSQMPKNIMKQMPPQQGMRSRMKNLSRQEIPNDLGLMPQTLIRPPRQDLPKFFSADWKQRIKFEWLWTRTRFQNFFTYAFSTTQLLRLRLTTHCVQALLLPQVESTKIRCHRKENESAMAPC